MSVFDIAPTILDIYGISAPKQMKGRVLTEIFEETKQTASATDNRFDQRQSERRGDSTSLQLRVYTDKRALWLDTIKTGVR